MSSHLTVRWTQRDMVSLFPPLPVEPSVTDITSYHILTGSNACTHVTLPVFFKHID